MEEGAGKDRGGATPALWREVKVRIERDIIARRFRRDEPLPSERLLAEQYGVHRHTLRRAMASRVRPRSRRNAWGCARARALRC
jgi:GntR family phosphonate transport system transcriptional regulator